FSSAACLTPSSPVRLAPLPDAAEGDLPLHYLVRPLIAPRDSSVNEMLRHGRDRRIPEASEDLHRPIRRVEREPGRDILRNRCLFVRFAAETRVGWLVLVLGPLHSRPVDGP